MRNLLALAVAAAALFGSSHPARAGESAEDFVRRMAEAGRPELAESQAKVVLDVDLAEPVSKAVLGALRAKRGDVEGAMADVATAALYGADEPFVQRTAGQLLAWHDTRTGTMAEDIEVSLEGMRRAVSGTPDFEAAYRAAADAYAAAHQAGAGAARSGATLVDDSVEAEFAGDADTDAVIYSLAVASCGTWSCYVGPSCRDEWCATLLRDCGERFRDAGRFGRSSGERRVYWGRNGSSFGRTYSTWSTPLGTFSRSVRASAYCAPAAAAPSCAPASCETGHGGRRR